jgi:hypothetical protein
MRPKVTRLVLAVGLLGAGLVVAWTVWTTLNAGPVALLTGVDSCYAGGESATFGGLLVADPTYGTAINGRPIMWPVGFTGVAAGSEVAVRNGDGKVVATTGRKYRLAAAPPPSSAERRALIERIGAFASPGDCYPWDLVEE